MVVQQVQQLHIKLYKMQNEMVKKGILSKNTTFENVVLKFNKLKQIKYFLDKIRVPILRA